jgi:squalene synthase HpnC
LPARSAFYIDRPRPNAAHWGSLLATERDHTVEVTATKDETSENFPVASRLIAPRHRETVLAFYRFARAADDVADSPVLSAEEKLRRLDLFEETLLGFSGAIAAALPLRAALGRTGVTPRHAQDLLVAFRMDATKLRYTDFDELLHYCRYSASPVGRFVLDVHGEAPSTWPANDALCSALQIINHLQDCGKDYHQIDRVYLPQDILARHRATVEMLEAGTASPALLAAIHEVAMRNAELVAHGREFSPQVRDWRLRLETAIIGRLAEKLNGWLTMRDPLSERVHLSKSEGLWQALLAAGASLASRVGRPRSATGLA